MLARSVFLVLVIVRVSPKAWFKALGADESMSDEPERHSSRKSEFAYPSPDVKKHYSPKTENLPNEPVLPWHRYDSPWLARDGESQPDPDATDETIGSTLAAEDSDGDEQLSLKLDDLSLELENVE